MKPSKITTSIATAWAVALLSGTSLAQTAGVSSPAPAGPVLRLSVDEAVALAREHNLDLAVDRLDPQIGDTRVAQAYGAFVPTFSSGVSRNNQLSPPTSFLIGTQGVSTDVVSSQVGVSQRLPWLGGLYSVAWDSSRTESTSPFTNFNPSLGSRLQINFSQPLLKDLTIDAARQQLITSRRNRDIADTRLTESTVQTTSDVKKAYWALVAANAAVTVAEQSRALADELARNNRARVDVGQMPPLDLVAAQAEVAQREEALIVARAAAQAAEDQLRTLILDPDAPGFWDTRLEPTAALPVVAPPPDVDAAIATALRSRADIVRSRLEIENASTSVKFYGNQRQPDLRFQANYLSNGVGGSQLIRTGGFPGTVIGTEQTSFGTVLNQLFNGEFPTWTLGFTLNYPLGRSADDAAFARARLEESQARARLQSLEMRAARQIRQAGWDIETNAQRIESTRLARELAEQRMDAEQKRFEVGMSTSFLVVQAQRDLAAARNNELQAVLAYERARVEFEALQQAGPAQNGGGQTQSQTQASGAVVTAAPAAVIGAAATQARPF
jgi:outer membrane protein TolC